MKTRPRSILMSAILVALLPLGALAQSTFAVFSPQTGLADGWKPGAWSGPVVNEIQGATKGTTMLEISLKGNSQPFAGVILQAAPGSGVELTDAIRKTGTVVINFKAGKNAQGEAAAVSQPLQLALTFLTKDGETAHGSFNTQVTVATGETVTPVSFTVASAIKTTKAPEQLASISMVRMQYVGAPEAGFGIVDCTIKE
jgi:hypothetical protein